MNAIRNLKDIGDAASWKAIRNAAKATDVLPDFQYFPSGQIEIGMDDIRDAVEEAERWAN